MEEYYYWLYAALHNLSPGMVGNQSSGEIFYNSYTRIPVINPRYWLTDSAVTFPQCAGGFATIRFFSIGAKQTGHGKVFYHGYVAPERKITINDTPVLTTIKVS